MFFEEKIINHLSVVAIHGHKEGGYVHLVQTGLVMLKTQTAKKRPFISFDKKQGK